VGSEAFVQEVLRQLKGQGEESSRRIGRHQMREEAGPYTAHIKAENDALSLEKGPTKLLYSWFRDWSPSLGSEVPTPGSDSSQTSTTAATKSVKQNPHNLVGSLIMGVCGRIIYDNQLVELVRPPLCQIATPTVPTVQIDEHPGLGAVAGCKL